MREFAGKTAVVTGAASGMGLAFARRFAAEGMNVVLADIEQDALEAQVQRLQQEERSVLGVTVNTMRRETLERLRDETIERFGNVHILCNNAGVAGRDDALGVAGGHTATWEIPDNTWEWIMGVNFWGVLYGLQVFVPHMLEHGEEGHIVNTASLAALIPSGSAYAVSKHAVLTLTEGLYQQFEQLGANLSASVLCPGLVNTSILQAERNRPEELGDKLIEIPDEEAAMLEGMFAQATDPADVAELVYRGDRRAALLHPAAPGAGRHRARPRRARPGTRRADLARLLAASVCL